MYSTLRRTNLLLTMGIERLINKKIYTWNIHHAVNLVVAGAVIASLSDFAFSAYGYSIVMLSNGMSALLIWNKRDALDWGMVHLALTVAYSRCE